MTSPYLNRPLRSLAQVQQVRAAAVPPDLENLSPATARKERLGRRSSLAGPDKKGGESGRPIDSAGDE
jgi:hypothetical protein